VSALLKFFEIGLPPLAFHGLDRNPILISLFCAWTISHVMESKLGPFGAKL
jgi:hypothetical protein